MAIVSDEHVLGLDVPVDDAPFVGGGETVGDGGADLHDLSRRQRAPADERAQRLAAEELGHGVDDAVLLAEIMDGEDVGVRERGDRAGLALEAGARRFVRGEPGRQDLDRHLAIEREVARAVHLAHAPGAERRDDLVRAESCAGCHQRLRSESPCDGLGQHLEGDVGPQPCAAGPVNSPMAPARGVPITLYTPRRVPGARVIRSANYSRAVEYRVPSPIHDRRRSIGSTGEVRVPGRTTRL